jgi:tetratricopeptide (TPR) repeat protein
MNLLRLKMILVSAVLGSCALSGQNPAGPQSGVQNHLNIARTLEAQGKLDQAFDEIRKFRELHPQSVDGAVAEAQLLLLENDLSDAAGLLNRVLALHPRSVESMTLEAELSRRMIDPEKTEHFLTQCTIVAPNDAETWKRLGDFYLRKQPAKAVPSFTKALKLRPDDALALAGRASAESDEQLPAEAGSDFARAISLNQKLPHPNAMVDLLYAEFLSGSSRRHESLVAYDRAISEDAALNDAYLGRAKVAIALQQWGPAAADLERIAPDPNYTIAALALLVKAYKAQGAMDKAEDISKRLERISAEDDTTKSTGHEIAYQLQTAAGLMNEGNCDEAILADLALLNSHPEATDAYLQSGTCYFQLNRLPEAEIALRKYLEHHRNSADALSLLGKTLLRAGRVDAAREQFHAAWLIDPLMIDASLGLAACSIQQQKYDDAEKILRGASTLPGASTQPHLMLAECLYKQHRLRPAMEEVSRALAIDPSDKDAQRMKVSLEAGTQSTVQVH